MLHVTAPWNARFLHKAAIVERNRIDFGASGTALGNAVRVADASVPTAIQYREQL
jgi:hypothetical protein